MDIVATIKDFISTNYKPTAGEFLPFDQQALAEKLCLQDQGKERGAKDQPASDTTDLDPVERNIVEAMRRQAIDDERRTREQLEFYLDRIRLANPAGKSATMFMQAQTGAADFSKARLGARVILDQERQNFLAHERALSEFRTKHRRDAPAHPPKGLVSTIFVLILCLAVEVGFNTNAFAVGSEYGIIGGFAFASFFTACSMGSSLILGMFALPRLKHVERRWKWVGGAGSLVLVVAILFVNLLAAHYRLALTTGLTEFEAGAYVFSTLWSDTFAFFADPQSIIMVIASLIIAFVTAYKGYVWFDPYPGYHTATKNRNQAHADWVGNVQDQSEILERIYHHHAELIQAAQSDLAARQTLIPELIGHRRRLVQAFNDHLNHIQDVGRYLMTVYREANVETRKTPRPKYFNRPWKLDTPRPMAMPDDTGLIDQRVWRDVGEQLLAASAELKRAHQESVDWIIRLTQSDSAAHVDATEAAAGRTSGQAPRSGGDVRDESRPEAATSRSPLKVIETRIPDASAENV